MTQFEFSTRSKNRLAGVHPDLVAVMGLAIARSPIDFTVLEGTRTIERQKKLVSSGASQTMNSRHLTGHAVDIAPLEGGEVSWDWPLYHKLAPIVKAAADELGVDIEWGGDWRTFKDGPHWQLSWNTYDKDDMTPRASTAPRAAPPAPAPQPPLSMPDEIMDLIDEASSSGSKTTILNTILQQLSGFGVTGTAMLAFIQGVDPLVAAAVIVAGAVVYGVTTYTKASRARKGDRAEKARNAVLRTIQQ